MQVLKKIYTCHVNSVDIDKDHLNITPAFAYYLYIHLTSDMAKMSNLFLYIVG